ncbi:Dihydrolipoyllysine-residue succinyltransferase component of 2-oxoglutarate dehydrogenase complex [Phytophthora citrophthora]|uniref:Dihydrolipoyllysine-residue succinyltransferase component of 2-oxoglutarate dehydrogenase complex n=1 Tax=Phytophthora citrophthora TaxID=4793 RepID=A0AAD9LIH0_9STRA|nr:Dihydrolipoyllysine-residue succinyltransferase component of 2-oxoglutarate dehydrogenase complex [Phytophthora citrophthora]
MISRPVQFLLAATTRPNKRLPRCTTMLSSRGLSTLRRAFHSSAGRQAIQTVNVPSMGDSISEGTLVEIVKKAGEAVHADEVVLVLETDKVSVDVTSPVAGTVVEVLAQLEDNVEVGKPLFTLDDALAPSGSSKPAQTSPAVSSEPEPAAASASGHRVPLIKFLGKRSLLPSKPSPLSKPLGLNLPPSPLRAVPVQPSSADVLPFSSAKRLPLSPAEVDSINSGLAFL